MHSTSLQNLFTAVWLLASASVLRAQSYPTLAGLNPYDFSEDEMQRWLANPNATGNRPNAIGPGFGVQSINSQWNMTYTIRTDIPIAAGNETQQRGDFDRSKFFTASRITFAHNPSFPLQPGPNNSDVRMCVVYGVTKERDFFPPSLNDAGQDDKGDCGFISKECQDDFRQAVSRRSTLSRTNFTSCYPNPTMPDSCKDQLDWNAMIGMRPMNNSQLLQGGTLMQWGSPAHDAGNLTEYRNSLRRVYGAFFYFIYATRTANNTLESQSAIYPGFQCIRAANVTEGSQGVQGSASGVRAAWYGWFLVTTVVVMALW